jgi:hypothetical protein
MPTQEVQSPGLVEAANDDDCDTMVIGSGDDTDGTDIPGNDLLRSKNRSGMPLLLLSPVYANGLRHHRLLPSWPRKDKHSEATLIWESFGMRVYR